ncbi:hypothetical protein ACRAWD_20160 [Caulobacter segnis]
MDRDARREAILDVAAEVVSGRRLRRRLDVDDRRQGFGGSKSTARTTTSRAREELLQAHIERYCGWLGSEMFQLLD